MRGYGMYRLGEPIVGAGIAWHGPGVAISREARRTYQRRAPYSRLRPPVVIGGGISWHGPGVRLTSPYRGELSTNRRAHYKLNPPRVVTAGGVFYGPKVNLNVHHRSLRRAERSALRPPAVVGDGIVFPGIRKKHVPKSRTEIRLRIDVRYRLSSPAVIGAGLVNPGIRIKLVPLEISRRQPSYSLRPPVVLGIAGLITGEPRTTLAYSRRGKPRSTYVFPYVVFLTEAWGYTAIQYVRRPYPSTHSKLFAPVVGAAVVQIYYGPDVTLVRARRGRPKSALRPPSILAASLATATTLAPQRRGKPRSLLSPPRVVFLAVETHGPEVHLTRIKPPPTASVLKSPAVVGAGIVFPNLRIKFAPPNDTAVFYKRLSHSRLRQPVVVNQPPSYAQVIPPWLAYSRRGVPTYFLSPPVVVAPVLARKIQIELARIKPVSTTTRLSPPVVVLLAIEIYGPETQLARIKPPPTISRLSPPADITEAEEFPVVRIQRTYSRRPITKSRLVPPAVIGDGIVFPGIRKKLVPKSRVEIRRAIDVLYRLEPPIVVSTFIARDIQTTVVRIAPPLANARLGPPVVVGTGIVFPGLRIKLVFGQRGKPKSFLRPPTVVTAVAAVTYGPQVILAPSRRGRPGHRLYPPVVVAAQPVLYAVAITLARSHGPVVTSVLRGPLVVRLAVEIYGPRVTLAPSRRPKTVIGLGKPAVIDQAEGPQGGVLVSLAPQSRGKTKSVLKPPTVVNAVVVVYFGPQITLVPQRRPRPTSFLSPPVVVGPVVSYGPATELAPSFRGQPTSFLRPPTAVNQPPAYTQVVPPALTYSRRGRPIYFLNPPTVVFPFFARKTDATFAPQARGKAKYFLRPPRVVRLAVEIYGPGIRLARIKPVPTIAFLKPPTDISDAQDIGTLETHLAPSKRGIPHSVLRPPAVVIRAIFFGPQIALAPNVFGQPKSLLKPPTVVTEAFFARAIEITLARITPAPTIALLKTPTVVRDAEFFEGPFVHYVRLKPPKVIHFVIGAIVATPFIPPRGDVCGFDISEAFICFIELPDTKVTGGDQTTSSIENTTASGDTISGGDRSAGTVIGGDQEAN